MRRCFLCAAVLWCMLTGVARAEIRTAHVADPADAQPSVSGRPSQPDIEEVIATYDSAGSLSITARFYNAFSAVDTSENFDFWASFGVSTGSDRSWEPGTCSASFGPGDVHGQHHVFSSVGTVFFDRASVTGYSGYLSFSRVVSPDQRSVTISATSPVLAGRDFRCLEYELKSRARSTVSNPYSEWSEGCGCWYVNPVLDWIGGSGIYTGTSIEYPTSGVWFDGFTPPAPTGPTTPVPPVGVTVACKKAKDISRREAKQLRQVRAQYVRHRPNLKMLLAVQRSETRLKRNRARESRLCSPKRRTSRAAA